MATSSDRAYEALRTAILNGEYEMGVRLGEVELASSLDISRTPIREALRRLAADGLVEVESNRGARVASWTHEDLDEIFVLRELLESHGAALAAPLITDDEIGELEQLCGRMEALVDRRTGAALQELNGLNREFHDRILAASGSPRLPGLVSSVMQMPLALRTFSRYSEEAIHRSGHHHRELVAAFRARDASWAAAVMRAHVMAARFEVACWNSDNAQVS
ncbi:GntR family transcriptional regulator [Nocardioides sp. GXZ039]|uniref:GntR family transcriptional regulator n=1 Tax=Nocardioides sp. GXZ039 TaxID=3136018 RepID=UPI0030F3CF7F